MDTVHEEALAAAGVRADGTIDINAALRSLLEGLLNAMMDEQASELGVPRNGYRERSARHLRRAGDAQDPEAQGGDVLP